MMIAPALLEYWLRDYYFNCSFDISCSYYCRINVG
jgi:hypothetical protein